MEILVLHNIAAVCTNSPYFRNFYKNGYF